MHAGGGRYGSLIVCSVGHWAPVWSCLLYLEDGRICLVMTGSLN